MVKWRFLHRVAYAKMSIEDSCKLIESGCDINLQNPYTGDTALHVACSRNNIEAVHMLLHYGADVTVKNHKGRTAFDVALEKYKFRVQEALIPFVFPAFGKITMTIYRFLTAVWCGSRMVETYLQNVEILAFVEDSNFDNCFYYVQTLYPIYFESLLKKCPRFFRAAFSNIEEDFFYSFVHDCADKEDVEMKLTNLCTLIKSELILDLVKLKAPRDRRHVVGYLASRFCECHYSEEYLREIVCLLLCQGLEINDQDVNVVYNCYGYCKLFKILLHMDIKHLTHQGNYTYVMPVLIYDVNMDLQTFSKNYAFDETDVAADLLPFFARPNVSDFQRMKLSLNSSKKLSEAKLFPKLTELARDASRKFIVKRYEVKNSMEFYTVLKQLPIANVHKEIISFERSLY